MSQTAPPTPPPWERQLIEKVVLEALNEQRRSRRWGVFFKLVLLLLAGGALLLSALPLAELPFTQPGKHTALVDVGGVILDGAESNAETVIDALEDALADPGTQGVLLRLNSPGGSPVQASVIHDAIRRAREAHPEIPIHAVVGDICASGCYFIAAAADKIFVNPASVVGSIGVIMNGFGFVDSLTKLGVERRVMTAGAHKALLDPFAPVRPEEKQHLQRLIDTIHRQFIDAVQKGRGERLKSRDHPELFSGLIWTGDQAIELGLVDALGTARDVAREVIGAEEMVNFTPRENLLDRLAQQIGATGGDALRHALRQGLNLE